MSQQTQVIEICPHGRQGFIDPAYPDSKVHRANMGTNWVLSAPGGPHVGPMNLAIWVVNTILAGLELQGDRVSAPYGTNLVITEYSGKDELKSCSAALP